MDMCTQGEQVREYTRAHRFRTPGRGSGNRCQEREQLAGRVLMRMPRVDGTGVRKKDEADKEPAQSNR